MGKSVAKLTTYADFCISSVGCEARKAEEHAYSGAYIVTNSGTT
jgi:hypothetical protein